MGTASVDLQRDLEPLASFNRETIHHDLEKYGHAIKHTISKADTFVKTKLLAIGTTLPPFPCCLTGKPRVETREVTVFGHGGHSAYKEASEEILKDFTSLFNKAKHFDFSLKATPYVRNESGEEYPLAHREKIWLMSR
jgi:hypothetical protein